MSSQATRMSSYYIPFGQSRPPFQHREAHLHPMNFCFIVVCPTNDDITSGLLDDIIRATNGRESYKILCYL